MSAPLSLRRTLLLETTATMVVTSAVGMVIGLLLAYLSLRGGGRAWVWPPGEVYVFAGAGVVAALLFSTLALPLLNVSTRLEAVRFE